MKSAIEVNNISFSYGQTPVLEEVHLNIRQGNFTALVGPNGGGKTTLLKIMVGLLKPDQGEVRIFGKKPSEAAHRLGYMPQEVSTNKEFPISVLDVVMMGQMRSFRGWRRPSRSDKASAQTALEQVDMWHYKDRRIGQLSGGQRQRVFIARALVSDPDILFLDEPTASVDSAHQGNFFDLLKELNKTKTIIIVNHDLMVISSYVKSIACVNRRLHYHSKAEVTEDMIQMYQCPVELVAHGIPHRVLKNH